MAAAQVGKGKQDEGKNEDDDTAAQERVRWCERF